MIYIVNYQSGNLGAITNMFKRLDIPASIATVPEDLFNASKIVLPGVGTFDTGMQNLKAGGWLEILNKRVLTDKVPTLGICLGMQLLTEGSEEGKLDGLGWISGRTMRFSFKEKHLKVPHMGWNKVTMAKSSNLIQPEAGDEKRFYFAHSYYVKPDHDNDTLLKTHFGLEFCSAVEKENILGVQFHPEKSHRFGMELLSNFSNKY